MSELAGGVHVLRVNGGRFMKTRIFVFHLTTLSVAQTLQHRMINELERI
jgi:hypothetical protein